MAQSGDPQYDQDAVCDGLSPDTWCGICNDCLDAQDAWRQDNGEDA